MSLRIDIDDALRVDELRAGFLRYTRQAYALIPALSRPRILDIGCGTGLPTIELARLSGGDVVGTDTDEASLERLRNRVEKAGVGDRVRVSSASLFDSGLAEERFDILWEEGVLHLLDSASSLPACHRLLRLGGFLVMHETVTWFEEAEERLDAVGFSAVDQLRLPVHCWWTDYYAPLESRVRAFREEHGHEVAAEELARREHEIALVKANPGRSDCGFFIVSKTGPAAVR